MTKWWLISDEDVEIVKAALEASTHDANGDKEREKAIHVLDSGLHITDAIPGDWQEPIKADRNLDAEIAEHEHLGFIDEIKYYKDLAYSRLEELKKIAAENRKLKEGMLWRDARIILPEEGMRVLVTYISFHHDDAFRPVFIGERHNYPNGVVKLESQEDCVTVCEELISYWMPLPEPPKMVRIIDEMRIESFSPNTDGTLEGTARGRIVKEHKEFQP